MAVAGPARSGSGRGVPVPSMITFVDPFAPVVGRPGEESDMVNHRWLLQAQSGRRVGMEYLRIQSARMPVASTTLAHNFVSASMRTLASAALDATIVISCGRNRS